MTKTQKHKRLITHEELKEFISTALGKAIMDERLRFIDEFFNSLPGRGKGVIFVPRNAGKTEAFRRLKAFKEKK